MQRNSRFDAIVGSIALLAFLATGCATSDSIADSKDDGPLRYEVEDGAIEGNIVTNLGPDNPDNDGVIAPASGDFVYMQDSGSISVTVNADAAGEYIVKLYYAIPTSYGDKMNWVTVNDQDLGEQSFATTGGEWTAKWIQATLNEGSNTIVISHSWGYTWFDYLTIEPLGL